MPEREHKRRGKGRSTRRPASADSPLQLPLVLSVVWALVLLSALAMVWARHEAREQFQRLQVLERERDELNIEWRQLSLELGFLARPSKVESLAREKLSMREPSAVEIRNLVQADE